MGLPNAASVDWVADYFKQFESELNGTASLPLHQKRKAALSVLDAQGLPSPRNEAWKYTNIKELGKLLPQRGVAADITISDYEQCFLEEVTARLVFINGEFSKEHSSLGELPEGLVVETFASVCHNPEHALHGKLQDSLGSVVTGEDYEPFIVSLNTSFVEDGVYLSLAKDVVVDKPVQIVWISSGADGNVVSFPRVFVDVAAESSLHVIENCLGQGSYTSAGVVEIQAAENATVSVSRVQQESDEALHLSATFTHCAAGARVQTLSANFGGKLVRNEVYPVIGGEEAFAELLGVNLLDGAQHVDNYTVIDHALPQAESNELYKGVYADKSKGVFNGTIIVRPDAQQTNAIQSNNSLLLSDDAVSNSRPQLKVWADDVKCTHGATIGQLEDDALFYLRSRGINKKSARAILVHAFAGEVLEEIASDTVREQVEALVHAKLNTMATEATVVGE